MGTIRKLHAAQNTQSQNCWEAFQSHRQRITNLVVDSARTLREAEEKRLSLAVLGAGNGNDLAIEQLMADFERIHLFDLDANAMARNKYRYADQPDVLQGVQWFDSVDLTGVVDTIEQRYPSASASDDELLEQALHPQTNFTNQQYDVVLSTCTLSQLIQSAVEIFGDDSPQSLALILAIRDGHLNLILRLMKTSAIGILVTDFVSSDTLPEILQPGIKEDQVIKIAQEALKQRNFFTGANPVAIKMQLEKMLRYGGAQFNLNLTAPWVWRWSENKAFCVAAIQILGSKQADL